MSEKNNKIVEILELTEALRKPLIATVTTLSITQELEVRVTENIGKCECCYNTRSKQLLNQTVYFTSDYDIVIRELDSIIEDLTALVEQQDKEN